MNVWDNTTALQQATLEYSGEVVATAGYTVSNDGGHENYIIMSPSEYAAKYGVTPDEQGAAFTMANGNIAALFDNRRSISLKAFGAFGDGVTDDAAAINSAMLSPINGDFHADGDHLTNTIVNLRSNKFLYLPPQTRITYGGPAGGTVIGTPTSTVLANAGILCEGGVIDMVAAGFGVATSSHQGCKFDLEFRGNSDTSRAFWIRGNSTSTTGGITGTANTGNNEYLRLWHTEVCGELLRLSGVNNPGLGGIITLNNFGPIRASFSKIGGIFFDGWVDTNWFTGNVNIRLDANDSFGIQFGNDTTIYENTFGLVSIGPYGSFTGRTGVAIGAGNRHIKIEKLFIDGDLDSENGNLVVDAAAQSYDVGLHYLGIAGVPLQELVKNVRRSATTYNGEVEDVTILDDGVYILDARADYVNVMITGNQINANGLVWAETRIGLAKTKKLAGDATVFDVTTGILTGTTGTDTHFTVSAFEGNLYFENRLGFGVKISPVIFGAFNEA